MSLPRKSRVPCNYCPRRAKVILRGKPACLHCERVYGLIADPKKKKPSARSIVLKKHPTALLVKSNIASWGVCVGALYLSYGQARPHLAWRAAVKNSVDSGKATK